MPDLVDKEFEPNVQSNFNHKLNSWTGDKLKFLDETVDGLKDQIPQFGDHAKEKVGQLYVVDLKEQKDNADKAKAAQAQWQKLAAKNSNKVDSPKPKARQQRPSHPTYSKKKVPCEEPSCPTATEEKGKKRKKSSQSAEPSKK